MFDVTSEEHDFHKCQEITSDAYCRNHAVVHKLVKILLVMKCLYRSTSWHLWSLLLWNTNQPLQGRKRFTQSWVRILISSCPLVVKTQALSWKCKNTVSLHTSDQTQERQIAQWVSRIQNQKDIQAQWHFYSPQMPS